MLLALQTLFRLISTGMPAMRGRLARGLCLFAALSIAPGLSWAASSVWKVSHNGQHLFVGGTVHILFKSSYPLPAEFDRAYQASDTLVFETDIAALARPEQQMRMVRELRYNDGTSLQDHLSPDVWRRLTDYLNLRGLPVQMIRTLRPGMVMSLISVTEMSRIGEFAPGVDAHFSERASQDGKRVGALETFEQQLSFLRLLGERNADDTIGFALLGVDRSREMIDAMLSAGRHGVVGKSTSVVVAPTRSQFPEIHKRLFADRNNAWIPQIQAMMKTPEVEFVLVGTGHLAGEQNVLESLIKAGYRVERFQ